MGKKGEALRAAKLANTRYTFTKEQDKMLEVVAKDEP